MHKSIYDYVSSCDKCQKEKSDTLTLPRLLQPLPVPDQIWEDITTDFIEGLPISHGKSTILEVVNRLSKNPHTLQQLTIPSPPKWLRKSLSPPL